MAYADYLGLGRSRIKEDAAITHWTEQKVKDRLPQVNVVLDGVKYIGNLFGRLNAKGTIWVYQYTNPGVVVPKHLYFDIGWKEIVAALNQGRPIEVASPLEKLKQKEVENVRRRPKTNGKKGTIKRRKR